MGLPESWIWIVGFRPKIELQWPKIQIPNPNFRRTCNNNLALVKPQKSAEGRKKRKHRYGGVNSLVSSISVYSPN
jgi:hypothetical protein